MDNMVDKLQQGIEQGIVTPEQIENLNKAIAAGYGGAGKPQDLTYGGVLQAESLDATLKSVTFDMATLKFWPAVQIDKAFNLYEQYNRLIAYGSDAQPYIGEGGAPQEEDSTYIRDGQRIAFFGTRRKVTHQMTLVRTTVGDIVSQQAKEGTMHLLKHLERELYFGNGHFASQAGGVFSGSVADIPANSIAMNGLYQQLLKGDDDINMRSGDFEGYGDNTSVVTDIAGAVITQDDIENLAVICLENFGNPDQLHVEPIALSAFVRQFYPQFRSAPGLSNQQVGYDVNNMITTAGKVDFKPNLFLRPRAYARSQAVNSNAPAATFTISGAGAGSGTSLAAGTYQFKLTAVNDFGESAPVSESGGVIITAGQYVNLTIGGTIPSGVKYFRLYASAVGGAAGTERFVGNYKNAGAGVYVYSGNKLPGNSEAFLLDMRAENLKFKQLSPLSKVNFAIVSTALEFGILLYGALFLYTPRYNGLFQNVGH